VKTFILIMTVIDGCLALYYKFITNDTQEAIWFLGLTILMTIILLDSLRNDRR
jgi:hypothetical protein